MVNVVDTQACYGNNLYEATNYFRTPNTFYRINTKNIIEINVNQGETENIITKQMNIKIKDWIDIKNFVQTLLTL